MPSVLHRPELLESHNLGDEERAGQGDDAVASFTMKAGGVLASDLTPLLKLHGRS